MPILVIGIGNPSRGDDAIGPLAIERLEALGLPGVELLTDFQLQVEHALDLVGRSEVVFVDATVAGEGPFSFEPVAPAADLSATTHALAPAAVLDVYRQYTDAPRARLRVRARRAAQRCGGAEPRRGARGARCAPGKALRRCPRCSRLPT
jgi:hydrogenase maturation protease